MSTVGQRIVKARELKEWTRTQLSAASGIPYPTLAGLENGDQQSSTWIPAIAAATGVSALWLASGKGDMAPAGASQPAQLDPTKVRIVARGLQIFLRRRDPRAVLNLEDPIDAELFSAAYGELLKLGDAPDSDLVFGGIVADLLGRAERGRNAEQRGMGRSAGEPSGSSAGSKVRRARSSTEA